MTDNILNNLTEDEQYTATPSLTPARVILSGAILTLACLCLSSALALAELARRGVEWDMWGRVP